MEDGAPGIPLPFTVNGYEFTRYVGMGTYSIVFDVRSLKYKQEFCAKVTAIEPDMLDETGAVTYDAELLCLKSLDHPNILRLYDYFVWEKTNLVLILEKCSGGDLNEVINDPDGVWTLSKKRDLMRNILSGLLCCIDKDIAHRDIKPGNILIDKYMRAKVADFGLSHYAAKSELTDVKCGSGNYAAPEMFEDNLYDPYKADVWSLGVTFYELIFRKLPWDEDTEFSDRMITPDKFPPDADQSIVHLITIMLDRDPVQRPTVEQISEHSFFHTMWQQGPVLRRKCDSSRGSFMGAVPAAVQRNPISLATGCKVLRGSQRIGTKPSMLRPKESFMMRKYTFDTF